MDSKDPAAALDLIVAEIAQSRKYRDIGLCEATIRDLVAIELSHHKKTKPAIKAARKKLHQVVALYLGDPDYEAAMTALEQAFAVNDPAAVRSVCAQTMAAHATTRERLPILDQFYQQIFRITGIPLKILDLACGLNPLAFLWMELPASTQYFAYDIHQQRLDLLNLFFTGLGMIPLAKHQDILTHHPGEPADVAFILKEVHRFERRRQGCTLPLLDALETRYVIISFPTRSLSGRRALTDHYRELLTTMIRERPWRTTELMFENELVFCIEK